MRALVFGSNSLALPSTRGECPLDFCGRQRNSPTNFGRRSRLGVNIAGRLALWLIELLIHDFPDGASTASATNSATETNVDRARGTALHYPRDSSHLLVAQYVAGANNHRKMTPAAGLQRKYSRIALTLFTTARPKRTTGAQQNCLLRQPLAGGSPLIADALI
jgi:hypothetical protein